MKRTLTHYADGRAIIADGLRVELQGQTPLAIYNLDDLPEADWQELKAKRTDKNFIKEKVKHLKKASQEDLHPVMPVMNRRKNG